jgi:DNA replication initiation complex subunit (GINS family)
LLKQPDLAEPTLEYVKRNLDSEERIDGLAPLPSDFYERVASYAQDLRRSSGSSNSGVTNQLIAKQAELIGGMVSDLLRRRIQKAASSGTAAQLLPEERYVSRAADALERRVGELVEATTSGRPSFLERAKKEELTRSMTLRFLKPVTEIIGLDMKRYGPFSPDDLAALPAANAELLVTAGDAVVVQTRDEI